MTPPPEAPFGLFAQQVQNRSREGIEVREILREKFVDWRVVHLRIDVHQEVSLPRHGSQALGQISGHEVVLPEHGKRVRVVRRAPPAFRGDDVIRNGEHVLYRGDEQILRRRHRLLVAQILLQTSLSP